MFYNTFNFHLKTRNFNTSLVTYSPMHCFKISVNTIVVYGRLYYNNFVIFIHLFGNNLSLLSILI